MPLSTPKILPQLFVLKRFLFLAFLLPASALGADAAGIDKTTVAARAESPPVIDGLLDDAAWANAGVLDDFHEIQPQEYSDASERTEVRILFESRASTNADYTFRF